MESTANVSTFPATNMRARAMKLLVIDDDVVHRMVLGKVGEKAGYALTMATSVADAAAKLAAEKFDCISLDLSLAGESGAMVLESIAAQNSDALLIITSGAAANVREEALRLADSLRLNAIEAPKPVDLLQLRTRLNDLAERKQV
jgi:CheY-like chemotaxis protein